MKNKIYEYEFIRLIAMICVVVGHSCYLSIGYTNYDPTVLNPNAISELFYSPLIQYQRLLARFVYSFHMPLFFILSGVVFGLSVFRKGLPNFRNMVHKKFVRLAIPFLTWGLLFMIPIKYLTGWYPILILQLRIDVA